MNDDTIEYAALRHADGTPIANTAKYRAYEKFKDAVRAAGGRAPLDSAGRSMLWNEGSGWHRRDEYRRAAPSASPSSGGNWRILSAPAIAHSALQGLGEQIWAHAHPWTAWPTGWRVRSAEFTGDLARALGVTLFGSRLILVNEALAMQRARAFEDALDGRPGDYLGAQCLDVLIHECTHLSMGDVEPEHHSPRFARTLHEMTERTPRALGAWITDGGAR